MNSTEKRSTDKTRNCDFVVADLFTDKQNGSYGKNNS